jgi:hypothetical protein
VVPSNLGAVEGNTNNSIPFSSANSRYQQIYAASQFTAGGIIEALRFRRNGNSAAFTRTGIDIQINLGYAATTVAGASAVFANNIGGGYVTVYDGLLDLASSGVVSTPNPFDVVIDVDDVFNYNPALGNLLLDIRVFSNSTAPAVFFDASNSAQQSSTTRISGGVNSALGVIGFNTSDNAPYGLVTRFDFAAPVPEEDWYSIEVTTTEQSLRLETSTPADGPHQFINNLNPRIELYSPSNALVASGVAFADGRNEFILYQPLVTGTYRVKVSSQSSTLGEYFLTKDFGPAIVAPISTFDVQKGAAERSFVRYVDTVFGEAAGVQALIDSVNNADPDDDRVRLLRYGLDGGGAGTPVSLSGKLFKHGARLEIDFGNLGLGGSPNSIAADGYYVLQFDLDPFNGTQFESQRTFHRLLGDVNGDQVVDNIDFGIIQSSIQNRNSLGDTNGDGVTNQLDRANWTRGRNRRVIPDVDD